MWHLDDHALEITVHSAAVHELSPLANRQLCKAARNLAGEGAAVRAAEARLASHLRLVQPAPDLELVGHRRDGGAYHEVDGLRSIPARRFARLEVDGGQHPFAVARYEHARRARLCNQRTRLTKPLSVHACFRVRPRLLRLLRVRRDGLPAPHRHRELTHAEVGTCTAQQVALLLRAQADGAPLTQRAALLQPSETRGREPLLPLVRARMNG
mmetsp:Transcript_11520/g.24692  ORF Transcript_11520/g.24692 Transcript_11520/m.24692 type:complete len:212 (+) Transcript_11520:546-1181(+)